MTKDCQAEYAARGFFHVGVSRDGPPRPAGRLRKVSAMVTHMTAGPFPRYLIKLAACEDNHRGVDSGPGARTAPRSDLLSLLVPHITPPSVDKNSFTAVEEANMTEQAGLLERRAIEESGAMPANYFGAKKVCACGLPCHIEQEKPTWIGP